jgi:hypothetical protein
MKKMTMIALAGLCTLASASATTIDNDYRCTGIVNGANLSVDLKRETRSTRENPPWRRKGVGVTWNATWSPAPQLQFTDGKITFLQLEIAQIEKVQTFASPSIKSAGSGTNVFDLGTISATHTKAQSPIYFEEDLNKDSFRLVFFDKKNTPAVLSKCSLLP